MRLELQPVWVGELLALWATNEMRRAMRKPDASVVCPMFAKLGVVYVDDAEGQGSLEMLAMCKAMEALKDERVECWEAVVRAFKPWTMGPPTAIDHMELLKAASARLAELVDKEMGE